MFICKFVIIERNFSVSEHLKIKTMEKKGITSKNTSLTVSELNNGLERFIEAQDKWDTYRTALAEVKAGKKVTHWIWFVFPQMRGLGISEKSYYYGIANRDEAKAYINHSVLRNRLVEITEAVYNNEKSVYEIFGNDAVKVRSCMLLFASVSDIPIFKKMLEKYGWK